MLGSLQLFRLNFEKHRRCVSLLLFALVVSEKAIVVPLASITIAIALLWKRLQTNQGAHIVQQVSLTKKFKYILKKGAPLINKSVLTACLILLILL